MREIKLLTSDDLLDIADRQDRQEFRGESAPHRPPESGRAASPQGHKTMGFFDKHGKFADQQGDYSIAEDGIYICRLKEVEPLEQPSFDDPTLMEEKYKWVFEGANAEAQDEQGQPYRFIKFTKRSYGNEKAAITILVDSMLSRHLTREEFAELDLEDLKAKKFRVNVELTQNTKGNDINKVLWVKPEKSGGAKMGDVGGKAKRQADPDGDDPFAE